MMGVFVQLNEDSPQAKSSPIGYVVEENGCWSWVGATSLGYGRIWIDGRLLGAHRVLYERHRGPIADGLEIDHLCRNRKCVNPDHLEAVDTATNVLRGIGVTASNARKSRCRLGHAFDRFDGNGRRCNSCHRIANRTYREKRKAP